MLQAHPGGVPSEALHASPHAASSAIWLDLLNPTDAEHAAAERIAGLRVPARDDIAEIESSSRLSFEGDVLYLNTPLSYRTPEDEPATAPLGFVLSPSRILTVRFAPSVVFDQFAAHFAQPGEPPSSIGVFVGLCEGIVDRIADVLERVGSDLDGISKRVFRADTADSSKRTDRSMRATLRGIGRCGDLLANLRDSLLGIGRIAAYVEERARSWTPPELATEFKVLRTDIASLNDYDAQLTGKVSFLLDAVLGFINIEQNNGVRVLTIASVVGIPPTFVVGLYGMNFKNMPELNWAWGYQWSWAMIVVSVIVPMAWFKVKGWW